MEQTDIEYVLKKFENFQGFMSVTDFRTFLILSLTEDTEENIINRMLEGGIPNRNIYYDVVKGAYLFEIIPEKNLILYCKTPLKFEKKVVSGDDKEVFGEFLSPAEQENLLSPNSKIQLVKFTTRTPEVLKKLNTEIHYEVTKIYDDLISFLFGLGKIKSLLVLDGGDEGPDLVFSFSFSISTIAGDDYIPIHVYIDHEKVCKDAQFLKINKDTYKYEGIKELKAMGHAEMFNNRFILLVHIKDFKPI